MKKNRLKRERNETAGVIIERVGESVEIYFKKNKYGKQAEEMYDKLIGPLPKKKQFKLHTKLHLS